MLRTCCLNLATARGIVSSLGGLVQLLNSLHPPIANGWRIEASSELSPMGIPWNECPAKGTRLGTFASSTIRLLVIADPGESSPPIALWTASNGALRLPSMMEEYCWYDNVPNDHVAFNIEAIMFDLLMGKVKKMLSPLSSPGEGK